MPASLEGVKPSGLILQRDRQCIRAVRHNIRTEKETEISGGGERYEGKFFIPNIYILQIRAEGRMENQQKAGYFGISALGIYICGLADHLLCSDPLYSGYGNETDFLCKNDGVCLERCGAGGAV